MSGMLDSSEEDMGSFDRPALISITKLKDALPQLVGKRISAVVIAARPKAQSQLYLIFDDDSHYEFYGIDSMSGARAVDPGGLVHVRHVVRDAETVSVVT